MGIISVSVVPRFVNQNSFNARFFRDDLMGAIRFARNHAVTTGCDVRFRVNANVFRIWRNTNCANPNLAVVYNNATEVFRPGGGDNTIPNGIAITQNTDIFFSPAGDVSAIVIGNNPQQNCVNNLALNLGVNTNAITVECATGYVR